MVATNSLAVVGPADASPMKSPRDLLDCRQVVLADPASPLGDCSRTYLESLGMYESLRGSAVIVDNSRGILAAIRSGSAAAGLAFASDAAHAAGCRLLLPVDPAQAHLAYWAGVCTGQREKDAQALLTFFQSPAAQRCFRRCGLALPAAKSRSTRKGKKPDENHARNVLKGKVKSVTAGAVNSEVVLELAGGQQIVSVITKESACAPGREGRQKSVCRDQSLQRDDRRRLTHGWIAGDSTVPR